MSSQNANKNSTILHQEITRLIEEWGEQVKEFRRLSLAAEGRAEVSRFRAKADTLHYSRQELMLALEEAELQEEENQEKHSWPGLNGVVNSRSE